ncbi:MAG: CDP-alcohol phosphatidyltransferase family protein [Pseudomonadota bacterium]
MTALAWIPNFLTLARCVLAVVAAGAAVVAGFGGLLPVRLLGGTWDGWLSGPQPPVILALSDAMPAAYIALVTFTLAAITDLLDGWFARSLNAETAFGAWLDPIADKLLVGLSLVALTLFAHPVWIIAIPAITILVRDGWITYLRHTRGGGYALPVMALSKWKTALELTGITVLLAYTPFFWTVSGHGRGFANPSPLLMETATFFIPIGISSLWVAAMLSMYTGWRYWQAYREDAPTVSNTFD